MRFAIQSFEARICNRSPCRFGGLNVALPGENGGCLNNTFQCILVSNDQVTDPDCLEPLNNLNKPLTIV